MMQKLTNVSFLLLLGIVAWYVVKHHDELLGYGEGLVGEEMIDSIAASASAVERTVRSVRKQQMAMDEGICERAYETFRFDPNTADTTALLRLGFPRWMVRSILKYRANGGRYQVAEDVKAIYGMTPELYERIAGYITIDARFKPYDRNVVEAERRKARANLGGVVEGGSSSYAMKRDTIVDLNTVDSVGLCGVRGIGGYRAKQILDLRRKLGAFVSVGQLAMIEGIPDSCMRWFDITPGRTIQINLNTASLNAMRKHPCIGPRKAADIERLRRQNGHIGQLEQLKMMESFDTDDIEKLRPYASL